MLGVVLGCAVLVGGWCGIFKEVTIGEGRDGARWLKISRAW